MRRPALRMSLWLAPLSVSLAALAYACSTADIAPTADAGAADTAALDAARDAVVPPDATRDAALPDTAPGFDAGGNVSASNVLINEISGGDEWVELVNSGPGPEDIGGLRLADRDKVTGEPKLVDAITFPPATTLAKGAYVVVRGGGTGDAGKPCPDGGQSHCFNAEFGISTKNGETLFLLAPDGGTLGQVVFPPDGSTPEMSYSRIPSGVPDAAFRLAPNSPGAPNVP